ncbi:ComEC/Rec2 family competence protein [Leptospira levettii]|uniref:ComEC/Rec2 family competence protein n=1 Tax=Leptospira levettii TaxID=2023178 RepID=A0AAW5V6A9_9LEPT|nr:ComEC/Rec2 family competence protein [Leptospira levettii]MCW7464364.1 ComEC/Rec2 family competence protein [Leptospira levettii]MCW7511451.1 ComEC/Rec2 family competence protein [Leptospira levettii]MCW7515206.1 ComEC/Rec2 family competence protein [Leptospira levettii]
MGNKIPGIYAFLFLFQLLFFCLFVILPPRLTRRSNHRIPWVIVASFLFLVFADTNQTLSQRFPKRFFSDFLKQELNRSPLSPFESRIVLGLVTGSTKEIPKDFKELAKESGILHLFAASGLHLGIFIGSIQFLGNLIFSKNRWLSILLSLGFGFLYLYVLNFPVSFIRAYLFVLLTLVSSLFYRKIAVSDLLFISSATIAFFCFSDFLSIGFLLSFSAVFGIFYLKPSLDQMVLKTNKSFLKENFTLTIVCSLCTFPVLVYYFRSYSYGGVWINYCLVPLAGILLPSLYTTLLFQCFLPSSFSLVLSHWIWIPASYLLSLFLKLFQSLSNFERAFKEWKSETTLIFMFSLFLILMIWGVHRYNLNQNRIINRLILCVLFLFFPVSFWYEEVNSLPILTQSGKGYFTITLENKMYLYGNCSPHKRIGLPKTIHPIKQILFESESCLQTVLRLQKKEKIMEVIYFETQVSPFIRQFENQGIRIQSSVRLGNDLTKNVTLFRFDGNPMDVNSLLGALKKAENFHSFQKWKGILVLDFPPWKKKEAKDWITYQKLLGISNAWKIIIVEDQFEISLFHYLTNPNLL